MFTGIGDYFGILCENKFIYGNSCIQIKEGRY